jgi:hypothetical protein
VVFDDNFETVPSLGDDEDEFEHICNGLFENCRDWYVEPEYNSDGDLVYEPPPLDEIWLTEPERRKRKERLRNQRVRREEIERLRAETIPTQTPNDSHTPEPDNGPIVLDDEASVDSESREVQNPEPEGDGWIDHPDILEDPIETQPTAPAIAPEGGPTTAPEGDDNDSVQAVAPRTRRHRQRTRTSPRWHRNRDGRLRRRGDSLQALSTLRYDSKARKQYACSFGSQQMPSKARRSTKKKSKLKHRQLLNILRKQGDKDLEEMVLDIPTVADLMTSPLANYIHLAANNCGYSGSKQELICNWVHPLFLKAKSAASKEDNPNWGTAKSGEYASEYWEACKVEIATLEGMDAWEVVQRTAEMNVIKSTWAFKCKRYPDGLIKKFKARFCARGDMQIEGIDFFETYAPVVQWTTVHMMLILEVLLDLKSKQGDVTAAFLHAELPKDEEVYVEMP